MAHLPAHFVTRDSLKPCGTRLTALPTPRRPLQVSVAIVGLALSHVLQLTGMLQWWVRQTTEVENNMTSVERLVEYSQLPQEPPRWV
jgi:hypothetical protein